MSRPPRGTDVADIGARGQEEEEGKESLSLLGERRWFANRFRMFRDIDIALTRGYTRLTSCFFHNGSFQKALAILPLAVEAVFANTSSLARSLTQPPIYSPRTSYPSRYNSERERKRERESVIYHRTIVGANRGSG